MRKYGLILALPLLLGLACGGPRVVSTPAPPAEEDVLPPLTPVVIGSETLGPEPAPAIPPTVFAPFLRRTNSSAPPLPTAKNTCFLAVEVRDYGGLDGCGFLLETDDGSLLALGNVPRGEPLEAGTRISIGFEYMQNADPSSCGNADAIVFVTCMRLLRVSSGLPRPVVCEAYDKPHQWLHDLAVQYGATYVTRFPWKEGRYVYLMETPSGQYLYDCRGYLICKPRKNCLSFIEDYSGAVVIYEGS